MLVSSVDLSMYISKISSIYTHYYILVSIYDDLDCYLLNLLSELLINPCMVSYLLSSTIPISQNYTRLNNTHISHPSIFMEPSNVEYRLLCSFSYCVLSYLFGSNQNHTTSHSNSHLSIHQNSLNHNVTHFYHANMTSPKPHPSLFTISAPQIICHFFYASSQTNFHLIKTQ